MPIEKKLKTIKKKKLKAYAAKQWYRSGLQHTGIFDRIDNF